MPFVGLFLRPTSPWVYVIGRRRLAWQDGEQATGVTGSSLRTQTGKGFADANKSDTSSAGCGVLGAAAPPTGASEWPSNRGHLGQLVLWHRSSESGSARGSSRTTTVRCRLGWRN